MASFTDHYIAPCRRRAHHQPSRGEKTIGKRHYMSALSSNGLTMNSLISSMHSCRMLSYHAEMLFSSSLERYSVTNRPIWFRIETVSHPLVVPQLAAIARFHNFDKVPYTKKAFTELILQRHPRAKHTTYCCRHFPMPLLHVPLRRRRTKMIWLNFSP